MRLKSLQTIKGTVWWNVCYEIANENVNFVSPFRSPVPRSAPSPFVGSTKGLLFLLKMLAINIYENHNFPMLLYDFCVDPLIYFLIWFRHGWEGSPARIHSRTQKFAFAFDGEASTVCPFIIGEWRKKIVYHTLRKSVPNSVPLERNKQISC